MPLFRMLGGNSSSNNNNNSTGNGSSSRSSWLGGGRNSGGGGCTYHQSRGVSGGGTSMYPGHRTSSNRISGLMCSSLTGGGSAHSTSSSSSAPYVTTGGNNTRSNSNASFVIRAPTRLSTGGGARPSAPLPPGVRPYVQSNSRNSHAAAGAASANQTRSIHTSFNSTTGNNPASASTGAAGRTSTTTGTGGAATSSSTPATSRPGAYAVTRSTEGRSSQVYRVTVPPGVTPGSEFTVHAGTRRVRVRCPVTSRPGHSLQITLPPEAVTSSRHMAAAPLTRACSIVLDTTKSSISGGAATVQDGDEEYVFPGRNDLPSGGAVPMTPEVQDVNRRAANTGGTAQTFLVKIPDGVFPGMQFTVNANGQRFMVTCPRDAGPGKKVRIVPPVAPTPPSQNEETEEPMAAPKTQVFEVVVPPGVRPNQPFTLMANGQRVLVTCPPNVVPGQKIRFQLPVTQDNSGNGSNNSSGRRSASNIRLSYKDDAGSSGWCRTIRVTDMKFQWVQVDNRSNKNDDAVDKKEKAGSLFGLLGSGGGGNNEINPAEDTTTNNANGGTGCAKAVGDMDAFDFGKAAFVRKIQYLEGNDARMRTGSVTLVPAQDAVVESKLMDHNYHGTGQSKTLLTYTDIANVQKQSLDDKIDWFRKEICEELYSPWEQGHVKIVVRRHSLLSDSVDAIMALGRDDMRKRWRFEFVGEPGIEAGGLTREWFQLITEQIFDPDFGLWLSSNNNQMSMQINAASHISCPEEHLIYFRFLGRVMGRALFDRQLIKGHMVRHLYKHILGWPITFEDLEAQDEEYYTSLKKFTTMDDLSVMCLDFTITEETLGVRNDVELIPGGNMKEVTSENLPQYLVANLKYRMLNRCKPQVTELLLGFFDIIPEPALTVFDPNELELILCGLPKIDMKDWMDNTRYSGYYETKGRTDQVVEWFWDVVQNDFDQEMKARLLQFVTGTSGVPPRGFSVLQGNDGNIKKFCVHGVSRDQYVYPRAHTCFNRIDLPNYSTKTELCDKLGQAVSMTYVGFDME